jgi:predicted esterase
MSSRRIVLVGLLILASPLGAQTMDLTMPGRIVERATAGADTSQTFAVYYPFAYSTNARWPLLFVMDPRGRAMLALRLFAPAAERHGFVVVSSYNTLSDGPVEPNLDAANAMLVAAETMIAADMSRIYIAGFSGTARIAWAFELEEPKVFAGILSASAAPILNDSAGSLALARTPGFAIALTTGTTDFNAAEVRRAHAWLRSQQIPVREEEYIGPHNWPPTQVIEHALAWFKLRGILDGRWPMDSAWLKQRLRDEAKRADSLATAGRILDAAEQYDQLDALVGARSNGATIHARARELAENAAVIGASKRLADLDASFLDRKAETELYLAQLRIKPKSREEIIRDLDINELLKTAAESDSLEKQWAGRVLALLQVSLGFYEPRAYLAQNRPLQAIAMLEVFAAIAPWSTGQCEMYFEVLSRGMPDAQLRRVTAEAKPYAASCRQR